MVVSKENSQIDERFLTSANRFRAQMGSLTLSIQNIPNGIQEVGYHLTSRSR